MTYFGSTRVRGGAALSVVLAALVAALALSGVSDAAATLSFPEAPTDWSVTDEEADGSIGKIQATGVKKNRIRYSLVGASGFDIKPKQGAVSYDGSAINADQTSITVTATDRKGKAAPTNVTITISVTREQPAPQVQRQQPPPQAQLQQQEPYEVVLSKLVRRYDEQLGRYRTRLVPDHARKPTLYASGTRTRGAAYLASNDLSTWTISDPSGAFTLVRMPGYEDTTYHAGNTDQFIAVDYNGNSLKEWTIDYTYTFTVTGTNPNGDSVTVKVVVCPVGGD